MYILKNDFLLSLKNKIVDQSPSILTGMAVVGVFTTTILAVKATPKAFQILEQKGLNEPPFKKMEIVKSCWKCYTPAFIMGVITSACIISANSINMKRNAALMGLYSISEATMKEYQSKVIDMIGEKKEREIRDEVRSEMVKKKDLSKEFICGKGDTLCYDMLSGRYFKSDMTTILKVQNDLNQKILGGMGVCLNELYWSLGLEGIRLGNDSGWDEAIPLKIEFSSKLTSDGTPCLVMDVEEAPREYYNTEVTF